VAAANIAAIKYTEPTIRFPQYGPVKPGRPELGRNGIPAPNVQMPRSDGSMMCLTGFQLHPSHGSATRNEASNNNATTPSRIGPRPERAGVFRPGLCAAVAGAARTSVHLSRPRLVAQSSERAPDSQSAQPDSAPNLPGMPSSVRDACQGRRADVDSRRDWGRGRDRSDLTRDPEIRATWRLADPAAGRTPRLRPLARGSHRRRTVPVLVSMRNLHAVRSSYLV
jgi:hypothetical protein